MGEEKKETRARKAEAGCSESAATATGGGGGGGSTEEETGETRETMHIDSRNTSALLDPPPSSSPRANE